MYYPDDVVEQVRLANDIVSVIGEYVTLKKKGTRYFGLCPFHNEKTPSFSVDPASQMYYCFGCSKGGTVFTFLMEYENMTYPEAIKALAERAGIVLPEQTYSQKEKEARDRKSRMLEMNREAAVYYYNNLRTAKGAQALEYLKNRGLSMETIRHFGLGYAGKYSDHLYQHLKEKGFDPVMMKDAGLIDISEKNGVNDRFWNRVMFPIMDQGSRVIGFGGRVLGSGEPKYLNSPQTYVFDKSRNLYGLFAAKKSRKPYFLLCEGYMDVISLHQAGFTHAVASLGTALTAEHAKLLRRFVKQVLITYDSDGAGVGAAIRAISILRDADIRTRVVRLAPYKDPDELIKQAGSEEYQKRIDTAEDGFLFVIATEAGKYDLQTPEGKIDFCHAAARLLNDLSEEVERRSYREEIARRYGLTNEELEQVRIKEASAPGFKPRQVQPKRTSTVRKAQRTSERAQQTLVAWMADHDKVIEAVKPFISPDDFPDPMCSRLCRLLYEQHSTGTTDPAAVIDRFEDQDEQEKAAAVLHTDLSDIRSARSPEKALKELVCQVIIDRLKGQPLNQALEGRKRAETLKTTNITL